MPVDKDYIICTIDPNHMWVSIAIQKPREQDEISFSTEYLMELLKEKGVKTGIDHAALESLSLGAVYDKEIVVARGKKPVDGKDGYYTYYVPLEDKKAKPVVAEDGSVDYLNSLEISMVEEGQVFASYIPPTKGEYGYTVFSEMIKPNPGKQISILKGKGFTISEDGKDYIAKLSGRIYTDNDRIIIDPIYIVNGDLSIEHGNITFNGDVEVRGDVRSGIRIDAAGSIFIQGHVGNCKLKAGGTITIGKGVQGKYGCEIIADGDVAGSFVERCNITSRGKVYANSLMDCRVFARDSVIVSSKQGCIIGGSVNAMQVILAKSLGNNSGIITKVFFGEMVSYRKELNSAKNRLNKVQEDIALLEGQIDKYAMIDAGTMTKEMEHIKMQIMRAKVLRQAEQKELEHTVEGLEEELKNARLHSYVRVTGVVYPGVMLMTESSTYVQAEAYKDVYYRPWLNEIQVMSPEEFESMQKANQ